jgi:2',3'-cyclic-nucleotide 2'-phosphodiesterase (5'-nucleotidase family)
MKFKDLIILLALSLFFSCNSRMKVAEIKSSHLDLQSEMTDSLIYKELSPYKSRFDNEMNEILAHSVSDLVKGQPESNLGNFVTDCILYKSKEFYKKNNLKVDAVFLNNGGLRASLPKGEISKGKIFELMPFDNEMVLAVVSGKKMKELVNFISNKGGVPVSGIRMEIDKNKKASRVIIDNLPLDSTRNYNVVSSDYLILGGDNISFFRDSEKVYSGILIRDILIEYCRELSKQGKIIDCNTDGRISISK